MNRWGIGIAAVMVLSVLIGGCAAVGEATEPTESRREETAASTEESTRPAIETIQTEPTVQEVDEIASALQQMSLREKVGQLFIVRPDALDVSRTEGQITDSSAEGVTGVTENMVDILEEYPVGGIVMFGKNIMSPQQITAFIRDLQDNAAVPLFMAVDEEGGRVARIAGNDAFDVVRYQSAAAVGESGDPANAEDMGAAIGEYLGRYGFNLDFAPVADVNSNPNNTVIGSRAFSADGELAAQMAKAMAQGLKQQGIIPTFKHFPGHGDTAEDSHKGIAVSHKTQEEMERCEWLPYESLSDGECVMVGHIAVPEITGDLTPASMSEALVDGVLRQRLNFEGVVITDSLEMGAITQTYSPGQAAINAIGAGCDILLCPEDFQAAFEAVMEAVEDGIIGEDRIDESVYRILRLKQIYALAEFSR